MVIDKLNQKFKKLLSSIRVLGIDQSFTGTGLAVVDLLKSGDEAFIYQEKIVTSPKEKDPFDYSIRTKYITKQICKVISKYLPDFFVLEGLSYGSTRSVVFELGGLSYMIRDEIFKYINNQSKSVGFYIVPPSVLKKYWTGSGTANKETMIDESKKRKIPIATIKSKFDDNIVDAYALATIVKAPLVVLDTLANLGDRCYG